MLSLKKDFEYSWIKINKKETVNVSKDQFTEILKTMGYCTKKAQIDYINDAWELMDGHNKGGIDKQTLLYFLLIIEGYHNRGDENERFETSPSIDE